MCHYEGPNPMVPHIICSCVIPASNEWIVCLHCNLRSYNRNDVEQRYCSNCRIFHDDVITDFLTNTPSGVVRRRKL